MKRLAFLAVVAGAVLVPATASANYVSGTKNCTPYIAYVRGYVTAPAGAGNSYVYWDPPGGGTNRVTTNTGYYEFNGTYSGGWSISGNPGTIQNGGAACRNYG